MSSSQVDSIYEKVESISEKINKKHFMKKSGKSISMQPKKSSEQPGCSKEEEYERLMMEMKILLQEKYEELDSFSDDIKKQKMLQEELRGEVQEKVRELSEVQKEFRCYEDKVTVLVNSKEEMDEDQLRSLVQDLKKKSDCESLMEDDVLRQQMFDDERLLLHRATREGDIEMKKLQRVLVLVLPSQMSSFEDVFSQKTEMEKVLDIILKESQVMKSKISDLELNSAYILEKNSKLTKEVEKLIAEKAEMMKSPNTFEDSLTTSSDNFSLPESSFDGSVKSVEHLNWEEEDARTTHISTLQKENEELQSKVAEIGKSYEEEAERKLDLVIKEKEEKEMLMNERDLASNKEEIEELREEMNSLRIAAESKHAINKADEDQLYNLLLDLVKESETLSSTTDELDKLKKDYNLALNVLQDCAVTLKVADRHRVELEQALKKRNQEIVMLRDELKSLSTSFEVGFGFQQEVCST